MNKKLYEQIKALLADKLDEKRTKGTISSSRV